MADTEKTIRLKGVDSGVTSMIERLKQSAQELSRGLIADARKYSESGKEQVKYIEEQIQAIEKRNRLEKETQELIARQKFERASEGATAQEREKAKGEYRATLAGLSSGHQQDVLQIKLLREIVDTIRSSAKEEIKENRKQVEEQVKAFDQSIRREEMDDEEFFKRALQREAIGSAKIAEEEERRGFRFGGAAGTFNRGAGLAASPNEIAAAVAALALIPIVGQGLSMLGQKAITEGTQLENARMLARARVGSEFGVEGTNVMGYTQADALGFSARLARARGGGLEGGVYGGGLVKETQGLMALQRLYGLEEGDVMALAQTQRYDRNTRGTFGDIQNLIEVMRRAGAFGPSGTDMSTLVQLMQAQNSILLDQSAILESVNTDTNLRAMTMFSQVGGSFDPNDPRFAQRFGTVNQALRSPGGDFRQAFVYSQLRRMMPNASLFELQEMQEQGINATVGGQNLFNLVMEDIMQRGGSKESQMFQLKQFFGLSANQTRTLFEGFKGGARMTTGGNFGALGISEEQAMSQAEGVTGVITRRTAQTSDMFATVGESVINFADKWIDIGLKQLGITKDVNTEMQEFVRLLREGNDEAAKAMVREKQVKQIGGSDIYVPKHNIPYSLGSSYSDPTMADLLNPK